MNVKFFLRRYTGFYTKFMVQAKYACLGEKKCNCFYYKFVRIVCGRVLCFIVAVSLSYSDMFDTFFPLVRDDHRFRFIYFGPEKRAVIGFC